jgi:hypothetical protein
MSSPAQARLTPEAKIILMNANAHAHTSLAKSLASFGGSDASPITSFLSMFPVLLDKPTLLTERAEAQIEMFKSGPLAKANAISSVFRSNIPKYTQDIIAYREDLKKNQVLAKSISKAGPLDVGSLTNFSSITGGQSLGYVSLDTRMARGTIPPQAFTLYNALKKTAAFQIVDYWTYASATGGQLPGSSFAGTGSVSTGTLPTSAGQYQMQFITLKLALDGRAITVALAAQNSFVDVQEQENTNAALSVLSSINWACYWGQSGRYSSDAATDAGTSANALLYPTQFQGVFGLLRSKNIYNFQSWSATQSGSLTQQQALYNLIYDASANIVGYRNYGKITHAFMSPEVIGDLQSMVTTLLNNIVTNITQFGLRTDGIVINGDLQGMKTRFGNIQFAVDILINSRNMPAQAVIIDEDNPQPQTVASTVLAPPASVTATTETGVAGSYWTSAYAPSADSSYVYAVSSVNDQMQESTLTYSPVISGIGVGGAYSLAIVNPGTALGTAYRVYRSGLGYVATGSAIDPAAFRYIGEVMLGGSAAGATVTYVDLNDWIPGSETIFLLDMDDTDDAIDYRYLLPLSRIELFASNLFMPWAVATIGSLRLRVAKFHGAVTNYVPDNPNWNPLKPY